MVGLCKQTVLVVGLGNNEGTNQQGLIVLGNSYLA